MIGFCRFTATIFRTKGAQMSIRVVKIKCKEAMTPVRPDILKERLNSSHLL